MRQGNVAHARQTTAQPTAAGTPETEPKTLTRRDVEEALGISTASVRRLEGKSLHPTKGEDGIVRFDPDEVAAVVAARTRSSAVKLRSSADGELAAEAFTRFSKGLGVREVVIDLRQPPEVIQALYRQWREAGGLWISTGALSKIRKSIAARSSAG